MEKVDSRKVKVWTYNSRAVMQTIIRDFEAILHERKLEIFLKLYKGRECYFCTEAKDNHGTVNCEECRIYKYFGKVCASVFPYWLEFNYFQSHYSLPLPRFRNHSRALCELKAQLRLAVKELEPWGLLNHKPKEHTIKEAIKLWKNAKAWLNRRKKK